MRITLQGQGPQRERKKAPQLDIPSRLRETISIQTEMDPSAEYVLALPNWFVGADVHALSPRKTEGGPLGLQPVRTVESYYIWRSRILHRQTGE